jgi:hypothetical protein
MYPASLVIIWIAAYVVGLYWLLTNRSPWAAILSALLIAFTHPLASLMVFGLTVLIVVVAFIFDRNVRQERAFIKYFTCVLLILIATPLITALMPNQMTEFAANYGDKLTYYSVGGIEFVRPTMPLLSSMDFNIVLTILFFIGVIAMSYIKKNKPAFIIILCSWLFVPLTLFNPVFLGIAGHFLPSWALARFYTANVFIYIAIPIGIYALLALGLRLSKPVKKIHNNLLTRTTLYCWLAIAIVFLLPGVNRFNKSPVPNATIYGYNKNAYEELRTIQDVIPRDAIGIALGSSVDNSFIIPAVSSLHVVAIVESSASPAADAHTRVQCQNYLSDNWDLGAMKAAGITYLFAAPGSKLYENAMSDPIHAIPIDDANSWNKIFKINYGDTEDRPYVSCMFNE